MLDRRLPLSADIAIRTKYLIAGTYLHLFRHDGQIAVVYSVYQKAKLLTSLCYDVVCHAITIFVFIFWFWLL